MSRSELPVCQTISAPRIVGQANGERGAAVTNTLIFVDVPADDPDAAARFYEEVMGWEVEGRPAGVFHRIVPGGEFLLDDGTPSGVGNLHLGIYSTREPRPDPNPPIPPEEPSGRIDGSRFVVVPGMVNTHIHITGEPLTRGYVPDDTTFEENVFGWLCPLYAAHEAEDERTSAQLAAAEMLRSGTTTFLEAGTVWYLDAVVDGLAEIGIRARVGRWTWDRPPEPAKYQQSTDDAIANLEHVLETYRSAADDRIRGWSMLIGHTTCTDELWKGAKELAHRYATGLNFHMAPAAMDPAGYLEEFGERPVTHLDGLGVLDERTMLVHCVHVDDDEVAILGRRRCNVAHCPTTALKVAYGITQIGHMPELVKAGANVCIGTD